MKIGMLWFNNSNATLETKIRGAMEYYTKKYGSVPNMCMVHPSMGTCEIKGLEVRPYRPVLPGHIWIGMKDV